MEHDSPLLCSCGAQPPVDAQFCHRCARPLREPPAAVAAEAVPEVEVPRPAVAPPPVPEINFGNPVAVRVAMLCAAVGLGLVLVPVPIFLAVVWRLAALLAAGFLSAYLYHRRTRAFLTVRGGARIGWLTGVFCFLILLTLLTFTVVALSQEEIAAEYRRRMAEPAAAQQMETFLEMARSPGGLLAMLVTAFLVSTFPPLLGGALGAKVLEKE